MSFIGNAIVASAITFIAAFPSTAFAYSQEAQQMCSGDALRLCSTEVPHVDRITACMKQKRSSLSLPCRRVLERDEAVSRQSPNAGRERSTTPSPEFHRW